MTIISEIIWTIRIAHIKFFRTHNILIFLWKIDLSSAEFPQVSYIEHYYELNEKYRKLKLCSQILRKTELDFKISMTGLCQEICLYIIWFPREGKSLKQLPNLFDHTTPFSQSFRGTRAPWEMTWKCSVRRIAVAGESGVGGGLTTSLIKIVAFAITFPHQSLNFFIWKKEGGSDMMHRKVPSSSNILWFCDEKQTQTWGHVFVPTISSTWNAPFPLARGQILPSNAIACPKPFLGNMD